MGVCERGVNERPRSAETPPKTKATEIMARLEKTILANTCLRLRSRIGRVMEAGVNCMGRTGCRYTKEHVCKISRQFIHFHRSYGSFCNVRTFVLIYRPHPVEEAFCDIEEAFCVTGDPPCTEEAHHVQRRPFVSQRTYVLQRRPSVSQRRPAMYRGGLCVREVAVSEKWFHDLNSQKKNSPYRQNKIFKCVHKLFYFCEWWNNSCNTYLFLTLVGQFLRPQCLCRQNIVFSCASACEDAIQTRLSRLKMLILYSQRFHRTKVPSSEKLGNGPLF